MRNNTLLHRLWTRCTNLFFGKQKKAHVTIKTEEHTQEPVTYSPEKQKKLEDMCEKLFERQDLIATGKLQMLGLRNIKRKLGKTWPGLQKIVFKTVEDVIKKYTTPGDIFIRYQDDNYVILFADAESDVTQARMLLIAEEIRRELYEHEEEELKNIELKESVSVVKTEKLKQKHTTKEAMDIVFQSPQDEDESPPQTSGSTDYNAPPAKPPEPVQVATSQRQAQDLTNPKKEEQKARTLKCNYVPLWDVQKNMLTTYLCLAIGHLDDAGPYEQHEAFFMGKPLSRKGEDDLALLETVAQELERMEKEDRKLFIACPVHYETLSSEHFLQQYFLACQKIPKEQKKYLILLVSNLPKDFHDRTVKKFSKRLKTHCTALFALVAMDHTLDFRRIRECGFDAAGIRLKKTRHSEAQTIQAMESFSQYAKKAYIKHIFALGVRSLSITTSAICAGYDYMGGPSIHKAVDYPDTVHRFAHQDLFAELIKEQNEDDT